MEMEDDVLELDPPPIKNHVLEIHDSIISTDEIFRKIDDSLSPNQEDKSNG
jgi:hypothetical protein